MSDSKHYIAAIKQITSATDWFFDEGTLYQPVAVFALVDLIWVSGGSSLSETKILPLSADEMDDFVVGSAYDPKYRELIHARNIPVD